jgi:hypothetical protein
MASLGLVGGAVYDRLVAACAAKARAGCLHTWNVCHFDLLGAEIKKLVTVPPRFNVCLRPKACIL